MCFTNKSGRIMTAKKDITCYKLLFRHYRDKSLRAIVQDFIYELNVPTEKVKIKPFDIGPYHMVDKGYHSYTHKNKVNEGYCYDLIAKAVIPKGSKYMINMEDGEYVSSSIMIVEVIWEA